MLRRLPQKRVLLRIDPAANAPVILPQIKIVLPETAVFLIGTVQFIPVITQRSDVQAGSSRDDAKRIVSGSLPGKRMRLLLCPAETLSAFSDLIQVKIIPDPNDQFPSPSRSVRKNLTKKPYEKTSPHSGKDLSGSCQQFLENLLTICITGP